MARAVPDLYLVVNPEADGVTGLVFIFRYRVSISSSFVGK
jgi:hypothetical protein